MYRTYSKKAFSSTSSSYQNNLAFLFDKHTKTLKQPLFTCRAGNIEILKDPIDFYIALHQGIRTSYQRIALSTLYLGTGNLERYLMACIDSKLKRSKKFKFSFLMDFMRGTRVGSDGESSLSIVSPLKTENLHNPNVKLAFYCNPSHGSKLFRFYNESGLREVFGVHHMKFYVFDDNVLLSGANLSESYFTERQDRYMLIKNAPELANWLEDLLETLSNNSFHVEDNGEVNMANYQPKPEFTKSFLKTFQQQFKMFLYDNKVKVDNALKYEDVFNLEKDEYHGVNKKKTNTSETVKIKEELSNSKPAAQEKVKPDVKLKDFLEREYFKEETGITKRVEEKKEKAATILKRSFHEGDIHNIITKIESTLYQKKPDSEIVNLGELVYVFPALQIPVLKYDEDRKLFINLFEYNASNADNKIKLASGYLNIIPELMNSIVNAQAKMDLITASPMANGFYNAGFFKKWVPYFYRVYEYLILKKLAKNKNDHVNLYEFYKGQWTFHSKGAWFYENKEDFPSLTAIGSTNYSHRSYFRDTELNFYIYSQDPNLKEALHLENTRQFTNAQIVNGKNLKKDPEMKFGFTTILLARLLSSFL